MRKHRKEEGNRGDISVMYALPAQLSGRPEQTEGRMPEQRSVNGQPGSPAYVGRTLYFSKRRIGGSLFCRLLPSLCVLPELSDFKRSDGAGDLKRTSDRALLPVTGAGGE